MKKLFVFIAIFALVLLFVEIPTVLAQAFSATTLKAGYFNPKGAKGGFIFGANYSWIIDESVDVGVGVDFFRKIYTDETELAKKVDENKVIEKEIVKNADFTTTILPIYGVINVKFPAGRYLDYIVSGGLGYEWLWSKIETYGETKYNSSKSYSGFKWILSGGIAYRIGSRSSFLGHGHFGRLPRRMVKNVSITAIR